MDEQTQRDDRMTSGTETGSDELRQVKLDKLAALQQAGQDPFQVVRYDHSHDAADIEADFAELEGKEVSVAGRLMAKRVHGKAGFADLADESGRIQLFIKKDNVGDEALAAFKLLDIGDIIGCRGTVMKTRTGQVSIAVTEYTLLTKTLQTLPEKFHGLTDVDQRYRQRYVDLIVNREVLDRLRKRSQAVSAIRRYLDGAGFLEVETPMLHAISGGATAEPFVTHWNVLKADYYLRIAIELHLKRLIVGGFERVYEIGRVFRNEGVSTRHNPEFTMLELYWAYTDYTDIMQLTEDIAHMLARDVFQQEQVTYGEYELDFSQPFRKMKFDDAMKEWAGCGLADLKTLEDVKREAKRLEIELPEDRGYEHCLDEIFKEKVEPNLVQPTFIYDYPVGLSPLAKRMTAEDKQKSGYPEDLDLTYRFELFAATMELANSFSELNDPVDQRQRLERQIQSKLPDKLVLAYNAIWGNADLEEYELSESDYSLFNNVVKNLDVNMEYIKRLAESSGADYHYWEEHGDVLPELALLIRAAAVGEVIIRMMPFGCYDERPLSINKLRRPINKATERFKNVDNMKYIEKAILDTEETLSQQLDEDFLTALEYGMPPTGGLGIGIDRLIMILSGTPAIREVIPFPQLRQGKK